MQGVGRGFILTFMAVNKIPSLHRCAIAGVVFAFLLSSGPSRAEKNEESCARDSRVVAPCYDVHGRLAVSANLRAYIGVPASKRRLGVVMRENTGGMTTMWPAVIGENITLDNVIWADYRVCPFTPQKPGVMQMVCIESVSNMRVVSDD